MRDESPVLCAVGDACRRAAAFFGAALSCLIWLALSLQTASVALGATPPTADSVSPNSGSGTSQTFTFQYSSVNGYAYLSGVFSLFNGSIVAPNGCYAYYVPASNALYLANDAGSAFTGPLTPGSVGALSNSQCTLNGAGISASGSGNTLTLALSINFTPAFAGLRNIYGFALDSSGQGSGWQTLGAWTSGVPTLPTADSVTPNSGWGTSQTFTFEYSSVNGYAYLSGVFSLFNGSIVASNGCYVYYVHASNALYLVNDAGSAFTGPLTPGSAGTLLNSQCTLNGAGSSASGSGNTLTLGLSINFTPAFPGLQNIYGFAMDSGGQASGWQTLGAWTSSVAAAPTTDSVTPNSGSGTSQTFTFKYSSVKGYAYLSGVFSLFNGSIVASNGCYAYYVPASNALYLANDAGAAFTGPLTPGSAGALSNSQCTLNGTGSSASGSGNTLTLGLSINFTPVFPGLQNIYGFAMDSGGQASGWQALGAWTSGVAAAPTADSVTPNSGSGTSQMFTFKYSSVKGYAYLSGVFGLFNGSIVASNGCYAYYVPASNALYLANDAGAAFTGPLTPGSAGALSNSQCTLNGAGSSASGSGNALTLALSINFTPVFPGLQNIYGFAMDNLGQASGWQTLGAWTSGVATPPTADSVTPNSGSGTSQTFTFKYSSVKGYAYLSGVFSLFNGSIVASNGCYAYYVPASNALYLVNDAGSAFTGPLTPGSAGTLLNSQCTLNGAGSSASGSGNTLTLGLSINFAPAFPGLQNIYGFAMDSGGQASGWQTLGAWTSSVATPPTAVTFDAVGPSSAGTSCGSCGQLSWSHTVGGSNALLTAAVAVGSGSDGGLSVSAACNGVAMTSAGKAHSDNQSAGFVQLFYVAGLAAGTYTVQIALTGGTADLEGGSVSFTGVNLSTPIRNVVANYGSGASASVSVGSAAGDMVADAVVNGGPIGGSSQTLQWLANQNGATAGGNGAQSTAPGAATVTMSYAVANDWWGIIGMDIVAAASGGGGDISPPTVPTNLNVTATTAYTVSLSWTASTDNVGVAGYYVYRNDVPIATTAQTTYTDSTALPSTTYYYAVSAFDAAGNISAMSSPQVVATTPSSPGSSIAYPLKQSANSHYFVDQNGVPILLIGDAPMSIVSDLTASQQGNYFADRQSKGFNAVWINLLCTSYTGCAGSGQTAGGVAPFTSGSSPSDYDLSTPNNSYFALYDAAITLAASYGLCVFLDPIETGGFLTTLQNNGTAKDYNYGVYLGNRYKGYPNIVWLHGNDYTANGANDAYMASVMAGIASVDPNHIQTLEAGNPSYATNSDYYSNEATALSSYLSGDLTYTWSATANVTLAAYNSRPTLPVFLGESNYEFENLLSYPAGPTGVYRLRAEAWGSLTYGGIGGYFYGNNYVWQSKWPGSQSTELDTPGAAEIANIGALMRGISWWKLAPDSAHSVVTAGYGSVPANNTDPQAATYCTTSAASDGTLALTYCPKSAKLTVAMSQFAGSVTAWWYDPSAGTFAAAAGTPFPNSGTQSFSTPGSNSDGDPDWILLLKTQ